MQVHPAALCETDQVGPRTRIWAFAHLLPGAVVGADCNICDHVFIEGGARLGDRVTVKNACLIWDGVEIGDEVFVGPRVTFTNDLRPRIGFAVPAGEYVPHDRAPRRHPRGQRHRGVRGHRRAATPWPAPAPSSAVTSPTT